LAAKAPSDPDFYQISVTFTLPVFVNFFFRFNFFQGIEIYRLIVILTLLEGLSSN